MKRITFTDDFTYLIISSTMLSNYKMEKIVHNKQQVIRNYTKDILKSDSLVKTLANSQIW